MGDRLGSLTTGKHFDLEIRDHDHGCKDGWLEIKLKENSKIRNIEKNQNNFFEKIKKEIPEKIQKKKTFSPGW